LISKRNAWVIALLLVLTLVAAACGGAEPEGDDTEAGQVQPGGTITHEFEEFSYTGGFDPVGEYLGNAWGFMVNLLIRNLVSYPHTGGEEGNQIVADLAEEVPEPTDGGTVYEFTIKDGVTFGPPVDREIVCEDVEYAFRRIATKSLVAQYGQYYEGVIEGLKIGKDPGPGGISGIECVDDKTVRFTLTEPTGDFLYRLAMPAAAPVPEEVAGCFDKAAEYGRYLVSSAGYMVEGSDEMDASSCDKLKPASGFDPKKHHIFVRRPNYDEEQATDEYRKNYPERVEYIINTNTNDIEARLETGANDLVYTPTPQLLRRYVQSDELRPDLHVDSGDRTWYITMNLNEAPFDDINVRKAANLVMDKDGLLRAWGGETQGEIATHIVPDTMLNDELADYDPYPSENFRGDVEAAKEAMSQSKYDSDQDGVCDAEECKGVLMIASNTPPGTEMRPVIENSLEKIGITLDTRELTDAYTPILTPERRVPISSRPGWGKDYPDVYTFSVLFNSEGISCEGNYNYSLVGLTKEKAQECNIPFNNPDIPNVDDKIDECYSAPQGDERIACWAEWDQMLMEDVVPWVPYLDATAVYAASNDITNYEFDQFPATPAWANLAVRQGAGG
jgi:peptide/nickel transport system substrate-binding protein